MNKEKKKENIVTVKWQNNGVHIYKSDKNIAY